MSHLKVTGKTDIKWNMMYAQLSIMDSREGKNIQKDLYLTVYYQ